MATCAQCNSKNIKRRTNYSHGKKSKSVTTSVCKDCGSTRMNVEKKRFGNRRR